MTARTAADVPELVKAGAREMCGGRTPTREALADTRLALSVVPAPLRPIDPDDQGQRSVLLAAYASNPSVSSVLTALRDLGVGLPARAEPSDAAVEAAMASWIASVGNSFRTDVRVCLVAAYAVDGAK